MDIQSITFPGLDEIYGVAPSGYGLGKSTNQMQRISTPEQADQLLKAGWYEYYNVDVPCCETGTKYGAILVVPTMWSTTQFFFCRAYYGSYLKRILNDSTHTWEPWEWVNPPLISNVEYRTTQRFNGRPVYKKLVMCGLFPSYSFKYVNVTEMKIDQVISSKACCNNVGLVMPYIDTLSDGTPYLQAMVQTTRNSIGIYCGSNHWSSYDCYVILEYTKL